ncbi:MAG: DUF4368 domain-containing protein [Lacrimispora sp.]
METSEKQSGNVKRFVKLAKSYIEPEELIPAMLHEFVDKIVVYAPDKSSGHRTQKIDIHYNFVGEIKTSHEISKRETA